MLNLFDLSTSYDIYILNMFSFAFLSLFFLFVAIFPSPSLQISIHSNLSRRALLPLLPLLPISIARSSLAVDDNIATRKITHKVQFNVRIARGDGTFATRDDDPDPVYRTSLVIGLYGEACEIWRGAKRRALNGNIGIENLKRSYF